MTTGGFGLNSDLHWDRLATAPRLTANTSPRRDIRLVRGDGPYFWDASGTRYADLSSQTMNLLFGHRHPTIGAAIRRQLDTFTFADQDFQSDVNERALTALAALLPRSLTRINLHMNDGSAAVEAAVKQARAATGRPRVLTVDGIYLGQSTHTIALRGWGERRAPILHGTQEDVVWAPLPKWDDDHDSADCTGEHGDAVRRLIDQHADKLACVVIDPVMVSAGVFASRGLRDLVHAAAAECHDRAIPLVLDESQTFGWVPGGTLATAWTLEPDALVLAKGIAGGLPLAVCASTPMLDTLVWGDADYTHGGHPASVVAMAATCDLVRAGERELTALIEVVKGSLEAACDGDVRLRTRGVGLVRALEIRLDSSARSVEAATAAARRALRHGVFVRTYGPVLGIKPPRSFTELHLRDAVERLVACVKEELDR